MAQHQIKKVGFNKEFSQERGGLDKSSPPFKCENSFCDLNGDIYHFIRNNGNSFYMSLCEDCMKDIQYKIQHRGFEEIYNNLKNIKNDSILSIYKIEYIRSIMDSFNRLMENDSIPTPVQTGRSSPTRNAMADFYRDFTMESHSISEQELTTINNNVDRYMALNSLSSQSQPSRMSNTTLNDTDTRLQSWQEGLMESSSTNRVTGSSTGFYETTEVRQYSSNGIFAHYAVLDESVNYVEGTSR